jgi:hypothetical protein
MMSHAALGKKPELAWHHLYINLPAMYEQSNHRTAMENGS